MASILVFDGAPAKAQERLQPHGGRRNAELFEQALARHDADLEIFALNVADGEALPQGMRLEDFDGVVISGSPLNVYKVEPAVARQLDFARAAFASGVPVWGSCWGLQLMCAALGGTVRLNPAGREIGIARNIAPNDAGRGHYLFAGRPAAFDALASHEDEVETLPAGAALLASNGISKVQAVEIERDGGSFVGVQYHPEYGFGQIAAIIEARREQLAREGFAATPDDVAPVVAVLRALEADPARRDIGWRLGADAQVRDPALRTVEFANWLRAKVAPRAARRAAAA